MCMVGMGEKMSRIFTILRFEMTRNAFFAAAASAQKNIFSTGIKGFPEKKSAEFFMLAYDLLYKKSILWQANN